MSTRAVIIALSILVVVIVAIFVWRRRIRLESENELPGDGETSTTTSREPQRQPSEENETQQRYESIPEAKIETEAVESPHVHDTPQSDDGGDRALEVAAVQNHGGEEAAPTEKSPTEQTVSDETNLISIDTEQQPNERSAEESPLQNSNVTEFPKSERTTQPTHVDVVDSGAKQEVEKNKNAPIGNELKANRDRETALNRQPKKAKRSQLPETSPGEFDRQQETVLRDPRRYRPRIATTATAFAGKRTAQSERRTSSRPLEIKVRILFQRDGSCSVSLLPEREAELSNELDVAGTLGDLRFTALQEDFYQDVIPSNIGDALRNGIELHSKGGARWSLAGRDLFVFSPGRLRGFMSTSRLAISAEEQLVLCTIDLAPQVEGVLTSLGCTPKRVDQSGVPDGWLLFREIRPHTTVATTPDSSILNVLRPQPQIEIELAGGIRFQHSEWIVEFPPDIRLRGTVDSPVFIDNRQAECSDDGRYNAEGWDAIGHHLISCAGVSRSYSISEPAEPSQPWPAYVLGGPASDGSAICGAAVLDPTTATVANVIWVPIETPCILGPNPGEIFRFSPRSDVRTSVWPAYIPFSPVWALPAQPFRASKASARICLFGDELAPGQFERRAKIAIRDRRRITEWATAILNSARKGLLVQPQTTEAINLWSKYHATAKQIWKARL